MSELQDFIIKEGVLQSYRGTASDIIIPEGVHTIDMLAFSRDKKAVIKSIQLPESLEMIENWAFDHCDKLKRIAIPSKVKEIGQGAFNWCRVLEEVVIQGSPKIGDGAFSWSPWEDAEFKKAGAKIDGDVLLRVHPDLTEFLIPSNIKVIGRDAFKNSNIKEIDVPKGVTKLDICAFSYSQVERISLPDTLKVIESYAFSDCKNLTELTIPKSVTRIDDGAFQELPNCVLTILNESDDANLFRISESAFAFGRIIPRVKEVRVPYGSVAMRYAIKAGLSVTTFPCTPKKFGKPQKYEYVDEWYCCCGGTLHEYFGRQDNVHIPDGIHTIEAHAFRFCDIKKVYLPSSVKTIDEYAFRSCHQLEEIVGESVEKIGRRAFLSCEKLRRVEFPRLNRCYDISFQNCNSLDRKNIIIPDDAEIIKEAREPWICGCGQRFVIQTPFTNPTTNMKSYNYPRIDFNDISKVRQKRVLIEAKKKN